MRAKLSSTGRVHRPLVGIFLSLVAITSFSKRDAASIDRDLHSLIGEDATLFFRNDFDFIPASSAASDCRTYQQFRQAFWQSTFPRRSDFVLPLAPVKLPWSLEQLKKLLHDHVFRTISVTPIMPTFLGSLRELPLRWNTIPQRFVSLKNLAHHAHSVFLSWLHMCRK